MISLFKISMTKLKFSAKQIKAHKMRQPIINLKIMI